LLADVQTLKFEDLTNVIEEAILTHTNKNLESKFDDDDERHLQLIHTGKNAEIDKMI
jgi:hypothetical protein